MNFALAAVAFAPGLALGSFLNVVAARVPRQLSIVHPRSACMSCAAPIAWYDNVPLISYVLLRGRCRSCRTPIGLLYPAVELTAALLVAASVLAFDLTFDALIAAFFCCILVAVSAVDLEHRIVPNVIVLPATAIALPAQTLLHLSPEWVLSALGASLFLFLAGLAYPAGMGMGDVKLALFMGAVLGKAVAVALVLGMFAALIPGLYLLVRHGSKGRKMAIPFAPFLALGSVIALFWGEALLSAYLASLA